MVVINPDADTSWRNDPAAERKLGAIGWIFLLVAIAVVASVVVKSAGATGTIIMLLAGILIVGVVIAAKLAGRR